LGEAVGHPSGVGDRQGPAILADQQADLRGAVTSLYQHRALRIENGAGLAALRMLTLRWNAQTDRVAIHQLQVHRGGRTLDLMARRALVPMVTRDKGGDGQMAASIFLNGLAVGDVVELAYTLSRVQSLGWAS
jgi:hypothetical protein